MTRTHHYILVVVLIVLGTTISFLNSVHATKPDEEILPARLDPKNYDMLPLNPKAYDENYRPVNVTEIASVYTWSEIVFQSYRDGNWEIYRHADYGYDPIRLTANTTSDIHPRLDRGATRIAFASNREGTYEIYTMNLDGSNVVRLTYSRLDDVNPAWSPDGTKIAFQSYRDGQSEIYVMNTNGSAQTRLTFHDDYDGTPVWSPDGTKIAFVSRRTGGYRIYTMKADGTEVTQISSQPYSFNPAWSPDGKHIAFNADGDGDGWQDLWMMNSDGSGQWNVYNPSGQTDTWVRSWSPDGRYITYTEITFIEQGGNWYWLSAAPFGWDIYTQYPTRLESSGTDWHPDWQTKDIVTPWSHILDLPKYSPIEEFQLVWTGEDTGGSDIFGYDIQYRAGNSGNWIDWQTETPDTSASFYETPGSLVYFRSRSRDRAYNIEKWPYTGDTFTTFYNLKTEGQITDNRGAPLVKVPVSINPTPLLPATTDDNGDYVDYTISTEPHTLTVNRSGYSPLTPIPVDTEVDSRYEFYLPPGDNVLQNSSFENGLVNPAGWQLDGTLPAGLSGKFSTTGNQSLEMGSLCTLPCLAPSRPLPYIDPYTNNLDTVSDSQGNLHIIWSSWKYLRYSQRTADKVWSTETVFTDTSYINSSHIAIDNNDTLHIAWVDSNGYLLYSEKTISGTWTPPQQLAAESQIEDFTVDNAGGVHILYKSSTSFSFGSYYLEKRPNGQWRSPVLIGEETNTANMAITPDNTIHFVWQETYADVPEDHVIFYRTKRPNGGWTMPITLFNEFDHFATDIKELLVDGKGTLHLLWWGSADNYTRGFHHAVKPQRQSWSYVAQLDTVPWTTTVGMAADNQETVHLVYSNDNSSEPNIYYRQYLPDSGWSSSTQIGFQRDILSLVVDSHNLLHFVSKSTFSGDIYYRTTANAQNTGIISASQAVIIPNTVIAPTLSFMAKANGDIVNDTSYLDVSIADNAGLTSVFSNTLSSEWSLQWIDIQPWAGQSVTVTFALTQTTDSPLLQLFLDDITLGSSYSDVRTNIRGKGYAAPGEEVAYTISYENPSGVEARATTLTVTLPAGLAFTEATFPPLSTSPLIWDTGDLPAYSTNTLVLTTTVTSSAAMLETATTRVNIATTSPEIEVENNYATHDLFIGYIVFLPVVNK